MSGAVGVGWRFAALLLLLIAFVFQLVPPVACVTPHTSRQASPSALHRGERTPVSAGRVKTPEQSQQGWVRTLALWLRC